MIEFAFILLGVCALASVLCGVHAMVTGSKTADGYQAQFLANSVVFFVAALVAVVA